MNAETPQILGHTNAQAFVMTAVLNNLILKLFYLKSLLCVLDLLRHQPHANSWTCTVRYRRAGFFFGQPGTEVCLLR